MIRRRITTADIRTYVVNLRRRPDRRERMTRLLPAELSPIYTSDWNGPFDGWQLTRDGLEAAGYRMFPWRTASANPWWNRPLKLGEIGCTLTHLACWRDAARHDEAYTLILEDDIVLVDGFADRLLTRLQWLASRRTFDMLYIGRFPLAPDRPVALGFVVPGYSHCTFGYLLTQAGIGMLLAARLDQAIVPVDEFLPAQYIHHPRPDLRARFPRRLTALACDPPLAQQLSKLVAGSDTENSAFIDG